MKRNRYYYLIKTTYNYRFICTYKRPMQYKVIRILDVPLPEHYNNEIDIWGYKTGQYPQVKSVTRLSKIDELLYNIKGGKDADQQKVVRKS